VLQETRRSNKERMGRQCGERVEKNASSATKRGRCGRPKVTEKGKGTDNNRQSYTERKTRMGTSVGQKRRVKHFHGNGKNAGQREGKA